MYTPYRDAFLNIQDGVQDGHHEGPKILKSQL